MPADIAQKYIVMEYLPDGAEEVKQIEREGYEAPTHLELGIDDPYSEFADLAEANKCAQQLIEKGHIGVWIDVLKADGDGWTADYFIESYKGETQ